MRCELGMVCFDLGVAVYLGLVVVGFAVWRCGGRGGVVRVEEYFILFSVAVYFCLFVIKKGLFIENNRV